MSIHVGEEEGPRVSVKQSDLTPGMQQRVIEIAIDALRECRTRTETAKKIKETADSLWGPTFHVFVGTTYACQVKYARGSYIFFQVGKMYVCLFKSPPMSQRKKAVSSAPRAAAPLPADFKILVSKMDPVMESQALAEAERAASTFGTYKEMALHVKQFFDAHYGSGWIVLFGLLNTGSFATRDPVDYVSFNLRGKIRVLVYRHHDGVEGQLVLGDVPERYYVQILPGSARILRIAGTALVAAEVASFIALAVIAKTLFAIAGVLHFHGFLAAKRCWPRMISYYCLFILAAAACAVAGHVRYASDCDHIASRGEQIGTRGEHCAHKGTVYAAFIAAYAVHGVALFVFLALGLQVRAAIRRVGSGSGARPLFAVP